MEKMLVAFENVRVFFIYSSLIFPFFRDLKKNDIRNTQLINIVFSEVTRFTKKRLFMSLSQQIVISSFFRNCWVILTGVLGVHCILL